MQFQPAISQHYLFQYQFTYFASFRFFSYPQAYSYSLHHKLNFILYYTGISIIVRTKGILSQNPFQALQNP